MKCIHIDAHVNTCVMEMMKKGQQKIGALTNYIIERFQRLIKDHYIIHKKSCKILKDKKYKAWRGKNDEVAEYVLPESFHIDHYEKVMKKAKEAMEMLQGKKEKEFDKEKIVTHEDITKKQEEEKKEAANIVIPGMPSLDEVSKSNMKKPMIIESDKYMPNFDLKELSDNQIQFVFSVPEESSAKDIDIDLSSDELKLDSKK
jgi:hypothetical protein